MLDARSRAAGGPAVESLNFAVPGLGPGQRLGALPADRLGDGPRPGDLRGDRGRRGLGRAPAACPPAEGARLGLRRSTATPWPRRGPGPGGTPSPTSGRSARYKEAILAGVYRSIAADCRSRGVPCVWVLVPRVGRDDDPAGRGRILAMARASGFSAVEDLSDVYRRGRPEPPGDRARRLPPQRRRPRPTGPSARRGLEPTARSLRAVDAPATRGSRPTMTTAAMSLPNAARLRFAATLGLLALGLATLPAGWTRARGDRQRAIARAEPRRARGQRRRLLRGADRRRRRAGGGPQRAGVAAHGQADRLGAVPRGRRLAPPRRRLPPVRAAAGRGPEALRPALPDQCAGPARPDLRRREARGGLPDRPARLVDGHGLGGRRRRDLRQPAGALAQRPRRPARPGAAVRGDQLRRRGLRPLAAARVVPPQGRPLPSRPGDLLGHHARHPAPGDPPLRPVPGAGRPALRLPPRGGRRRRDHARRPQGRRGGQAGA